MMVSTQLGPRAGARASGLASSFTTSSTAWLASLAKRKGRSGKSIIAGSWSSSRTRWNGAGGDTLQNSSVIIDDSDNITGINSITMAESKYLYFDSTDTYIYANTDDPEDLVIGADQDILLLL